MGRPPKGWVGSHNHTEIPIGEVPKRPTGTDCKSVDLCLHRFESCLPHLPAEASAKVGDIEPNLPMLKLRQIKAGVAHLVER